MTDANPQQEAGKHSALPASPSVPTEGEGPAAGQWHGPKCWGRTSFSEEVAHCYCQKATVNLIDREYSEELCNRLKLLSDRVDGTTHLNGELVRFRTVFDRAIAQIERFTALPIAPPSLGMSEANEPQTPTLKSGDREADDLDLYDDKVQAGIVWTMRQWGEALGLTTWTQGDGSESVEGDVGAEIHTILVDAGLRDEETNEMARLRPAGDYEGLVERADRAISIGKRCGADGSRPDHNIYVIAEELTAALRQLTAPDASMKGRG